MNEFDSELFRPLYKTLDYIFNLMSKCTQSLLNVSFTLCSESLGSPVPLLLPLASSDSIYPPPSVSLPSLVPGPASAPVSSSCTSSSSSSSTSSVSSSAGNGFDCALAPHSRLTFSQSKEAPGPVTVSPNGLRRRYYRSVGSYKH